MSADTNKYGFVGFENTSADPEKKKHNFVSFNPADDLSEEEEEESFLKNAWRNVNQVATGAAHALTWPFTAIDSLNKRLKEEREEDYQLEQERSERLGIEPPEEREAPFDFTDYFPTQAKGEEFLEKNLGIPLKAKTDPQKAIRFLTTVATSIPGSLSQKTLGATTATYSREKLIEMGIPEDLADFMAGMTGVKIGKESPKIEVLPKQKASGLPKRRFEKLKEPIDVTPNKLAKINKKVEGDFRDIAENIAEEGPVAETRLALKNDVTFKNRAQEAFGEVQELAEQIPDRFPTLEVKKSLADKGAQNIGRGITPNEQDKVRRRFIKEFIEDTPDKEMTLSDLVNQYRDNNAAFGQTWEGGQSYAYNLGKRQALLDYNHAIAEMIDQKFPDSEFANLFKNTNKRWSEIMDSESIDNYLDNIFKDKIDFKTAEKFLSDKKTSEMFKRALGKEGFNDFKQLVYDLMSSQTPYKMLKVAEKQGFFESVGKTAIAFVMHPLAAKAKIGWDAIQATRKGLSNLLLDSPQYTVVWDKGIKNLKKGNFKEAEKQFTELQEAIEAKEVEAELLPAEIKTQVPEKSAETIEAKVEPVSKAKPETQQIEAPKERPQLTHKDEGVKAAVEREKGSKEHEPKAVEEKPVKQIEPKKEPVKTPEIKHPETRGKGHIFHGSPKAIESPSHGHYSWQNIYGQGFYTTDAMDIAHGYSTRKGSKEGVIYEVKEKRPTKLFDMEKPIPKEIRKQLEDLPPYSTTNEFLSDDKNQTVRQLYDSMRRESNLSADEIQEDFDDIEQMFRYEGYDGYKHIGGLIQGKEPHEVKIYFMPEEVLTIKEIDKKADYSKAKEEKPKRTAKPFEEKMPVDDVLEELKKKRDAIKGKDQEAVKKRSPLTIRINELELEKYTAYKEKLLNKSNSQDVKPKQSLTEPKVEELKRQDITKNGLKNQKEFILDKINDILDNPTKYKGQTKIVLNVPGDGEFKIHNDEKALRQFAKDVEKKWPDKPYRKIRQKTPENEPTQKEYEEAMKEKNRPSYKEKNTLSSKEIEFIDDKFKKIIQLDKKILEIESKKSSGVSASLVGEGRHIHSDLKKGNIRKQSAIYKLETTRNELFEKIDQKTKDLSKDEINEIWDKYYHSKRYS